MQLSAREIAQKAAQLARRHLVSLLLVAMPFALASVWLEQSLLGAYPKTIGDFRLVSILDFYGTSVIASFANAASALAMALRIRPTSNSPHRARTLRKLGFALVIALVAPMGTLAGLAVAIVPGIIVWLSWFVAPVAAAVAGETPLAALRLSARLTWGSRKSLFYLAAALQVSTFLISCAIALAMGRSASAALLEPGPLSPGESVIGWLLESAQLVISGSICAAFFIASKAAEENVNVTDRIRRHRTTK